MHAPKTAGGHVLCLSLGLFVVVVLAHYAASLTALLTSDALTSTIKDISDVENRNFVVCVQGVILPLFEAKYPTVTTLAALDEKALFEKLENRECAAAVLGSSARLSARQGCACSHPY